ncbi:MAG: sigma 54-interacting transcriptional regulator [Bacteroidetes bacterium]|nr:sigma 54-interacting transcriptional regulator [Bacteroidota bacterium]
MSENKKRHDEIIKRSHERSRKLGIERDQTFSKRILKGREIASQMELNTLLLDVAEPFMEFLYKFLEASGFIIVLTSDDGCILRIVGDPEPIFAARNLNMVIGAYMDEASIGTNAMGTAIREDAPIQITAKEHFINAYHTWTCSAAPIHDTEGNTIGCLNLTGNAQLVHPHTLGLVVAAVHSIENQLATDLSQRMLFDAHQYLNTVMDTLTLGVFTADAAGTILSLNHAATKLMNIDKDFALGKNIGEFIPNWMQIREQVANGKKYLDEETVIHIGARKETFSLNAYITRNQEGEITGMVTSFREMQRVYKLVNKYTGMNARYTFEDLIGESDQIHRIIEYAKTISDSPSTVLIQAESGTGKELFAQAIHNHSNRSENGFVAVNCGAIPATLIESELFGYEEGAFTGAKKGGRMGKFELANGGTLFLDEIGEMPIEMQVKLLRTIQEGYITRVGGDKVIPVDVRIIAATNRDLLEEVSKGNFRMDLYYRLSVIPVSIPPLKDRKEDIPLLIKYFLNMKSMKLHRNVPDMTNELFRQLLAYNWPGNIRELENFIEKFVNLDGNIDLAGILFPTHGPLTIQTVPDFVLEDDPLQTLEEMERKAIIKALNKLNKNMSQVAKSLGISRNTLYQKLKKYDILLD